MSEISSGGLVAARASGSRLEFSADSRRYSYILDLTCPDRVDAESLSAERPRNALITPAVPVDLRTPILNVGLWSLSTLTASLMAVPKAAVHEYNESSSREVEVRCACKLLRVPLAAYLHRPKRGRKSFLRLGAFPPNRLHYLPTFSLRERVNHLASARSGSPRRRAAADAGILLRCLTYHR